MAKHDYTISILADGAVLDRRIDADDYESRLNGDGSVTVHFFTGEVLRDDAVVARIRVTSRHTYFIRKDR